MADYRRFKTLISIRNHIKKIMVIRFQIDKQPEKVEMYHKELLK